MSEEIKDCPFCSPGAEARLYDATLKQFEQTQIIHYIGCTLCRIETKAYHDKDLLIRLWNSRGGGE